ncbi:MAG: tetratricopeptide repeat protein [Acidobacteriaceae bacterium]
MECIVASKLLRRLCLIATVLICGTMFSLAMGPERLLSPATSGPGVYQSIRQDLNAGRADEAIFLLQEQLSKNSANAAAHDLLCRVYIQEEQWPDAEKECTRAVELEPKNSAYHLWLGRAYGGAAAHASLASAYQLAKKVRAEFETAVRLDPNNVSALSDLGEYLIDVPRILGGGVSQAEQIAQQLAPLSPAHYHELQAKICYKKSDFAGAEQQWKLAIRSSPNPADQWMNLAGFYADRKNFPAMQQAIQNGMAADPAHGKALVLGATLLMRKHQNLQQARRMLQRYLASRQRSEDAPAFQVYVQLGNLLASQGDPIAAEREYAAARALAGNYAPAQQAPGG